MIENYNKEQISLNPTEKELSLAERLERVKTENKELKEKLENLRISFNLIAHDLRNPLGSTMQLLNLLCSNIEKGKIDNNHLLELLKSISQNSNNTFKLFEDILEFNRLQQDNKKLEILTLNLAGQIEDSIVPLLEQAKLKKVNLQNKVSNNINILANSNMLQAVIRNLSSNAIKFTKEGGNIEISSEKKDNVIEISIKDNGVGINKEKLEKLFKNIVVSAEGTDGEKGTGLGLLMCKEMIDKMNGTIRVESEEGKGTTFIVTLPSGEKNR